MIRVINLDRKTINLNHIDILPGNSYTWLDSEISFSFRRKLYRLREIGYIQLEETPDYKEESIVSNEENLNKEDNLENEIEKPKKKNTRKKSQKKEE